MVAQISISALEEARSNSFDGSLVVWQCEGVFGNMLFTNYHSLRYLGPSFIKKMIDCTQDSVSCPQNGAFTGR